MSLQDKAKNKLQWVVGQARTVAGRATGNRSMADEGRRTQSRANLKDAGEKIKDAFRR